MGGGGDNYPTLFRIQHLLYTNIPSPKGTHAEKSQTAIKIVLPNIKRYWGQLAHLPEKRQLLNKTRTTKHAWKTRTPASFCTFPTFGAPNRSKIASTEKGNTHFYPQTRWHLENGETLAMFCFKESWHAAAQSLWIGKEFVPIILRRVSLKNDPGHFAKKLPIFFHVQKRWSSIFNRNMPCFLFGLGILQFEAS